MDTPPTSNSSWTYSIVAALAMIFASVLTAVFSRRKSTSKKEEAEARSIDAGVVEKLYHLIDQAITQDAEKEAELHRLRDLERRHEALVLYTRRCEAVLRQHGIELPEKYMPGDYGD